MSRFEDYGTRPMSRFEAYGREDADRIYMTSEGGMPPSPEVMAQDDLLIRVRRLELQMKAIMEFKTQVWKAIEAIEKHLDETVDGWADTDLDRMLKKELKEEE